VNKEYYCAYCDEDWEEGETDGEECPDCGDFLEEHEDNE